MSAILTFLAAAGAVATVVISKWTLDQAGKATIEARNATTEARRAADEAHNQAIEAKRQADIAENAFKSGNRPVIVTEGIAWKAPLLKDTANSVKIFYNNIGKDNTTAFVYEELIIGPAGKWEENRFDFGPNNTCDIANYRSPDTPIQTAITGHSFHKDYAVDAVTVNRVLSGESVGLRGCFFYGDFGEMLTTTFCYVAAVGSNQASVNESPLCAR